MKGNFKNILSLVAATRMARIAHCRCSDDCAIVFLLHRASGVYDNIHGDDPAALERILIDLKRRKFNLVPLHQVVDAALGKGTLPSESIAFTMDDGYRDQLEVIAPIFVKHAVPLTVFLTTGLVNGELWPWDAKIIWLINQARQASIEIQVGHHRLNYPLGSHQERLNTRRELQSICAALPSEKIDRFLHTLEVAVGIAIPDAPPEEFSPASWDQVRQLERAGVRFAPHTHSHRIMSRLPEAEVRSELSRSLEIVLAETCFGLPVIAWPVGMEHHFGMREMHLAESMGFSAAFGVGLDYARWGEARMTSELRYSLSRFALPSSPAEVLWFATGLEALDQNVRNFMRDNLGVATVTGHSSEKRHRSPKLLNKAFLNRLAGKVRLASGLFDDLKQIHAARIERLVFVCLGNVCRSPYAEVAANSLGLSATSCGIDVTRSILANSVGVRAGLLRGKDLSGHMSRSIFDVPLVGSDCLVAMDPSHLPVARNVAARFGCQVTLMGLWREPHVTQILDPYGRSLRDFQQCFDVIDESLVGLATWIKQTNGDRA